uniref:Secreted protein n=1 Tax=Meloidogyne hapla TaxID=6305 RepID=A0A1I8BWG6_MELHA
MELTTLVFIQLCVVALVSSSGQCCYDGNDYKNCFECRRPFTCYEGKYCHYVPPTPPPTTTTTPKPPTPCDEYGNCPDGYKCEGDVCVKDY